MYMYNKYKTIGVDRVALDDVRGVFKKLTTIFF